MAPTLLDQFLLVLGAITFILIVLYLLYGGLRRTFTRVGFTPGQAGLILLGTLFGAFINIPLFEMNGWTVALNVGGAGVPLVVTYLLLRRNPALTLEVLAGTTIVAIVTYLVTTPTDAGIVSPFPWYLLPPFIAAGVAFLAFWREEGDSAPLAYMIGTLGAIIGADVFRLPEFLAQAPPEAGGVAAIGGAAVLDMVYLTGVIAVTLDALFFSQLETSQEPSAMSTQEHLVFRMSTPSAVIREYDPAAIQAAGEEERRPSLMQRMQDATQETERRLNAERQRLEGTERRAQGGGAAAGRQGAERHREWEERLRERR